LAEVSGVCTAVVSLLTADYPFLAARRVAYGAGNSFLGAAIMFVAAGATYATGVWLKRISIEASSREG
jgi:hypothetical protein